MALSGALTKAGFEPKALDVTAAVNIEKDGEGFTVRSSKLKLRAQVPNIDGAKFSSIAEDAKKNCPISKLLNAEITLEARLEGSQTFNGTKPNQQSSSAV